MKIKRTFIFILLSIFFITLKASSADILWRLTHNDQYALVIAQAVGKSSNKLVFEIKHKVSGKTVPKKINLDVNTKYTLLNTEIKLKDYCVLSLDKKNNKYVIKNGIYKANTYDYKKLKLEKGTLLNGLKGDLTALEYYINSNGKYNDFVFDSGTVYLRFNNGQKIQIYPPAKK